MTISNEKEFLAKHGFNSREAYNKKQRAILEKKINPFIKFYKIFLLTFSFTKNLLSKIIVFFGMAFVILFVTLWGASMLISLISIPLTNKYGYWQIYQILLMGTNEDSIESGILRFFLFILFLFIQLFVICGAWIIFTNVWWSWLGFGEDEKEENKYD